MSNDKLQAQLQSLQAENERLQEQLTLQKEEVKQLAKMEALRDFIGDMSHDLRTPITVIKTSAYLLQNTTDDEKRQKHLRILEMQVEHLESLVSDMVTMSRLDANVTTFDIRRVRLNDLVNSLLEAVFPLAIDKSLELQVTPPPEALPLTMVDRMKVHSALLHILQNAIMYTPPGGKIKVRTYAEAGWVVVEVQDSGIGISAQDLPHIFDRFYRADKARSASTGNTGLGLTIAKKIVERHHGRIEVQSKVGEGSTFRVYLRAI